MVATTTERGESALDRFMLRLLRLPEERSGTTADAQSAFQQSIVISSVRCLLTYIILPFVAPMVGVLASIGPVLGIVVSVAAVASIVVSTRRFWRVRHRHRWSYTVLGGLMLCFILFLVVRDVAAL